MKIRTLATVLDQIEKLQAEADQLRKQERVGVIERIREAIVFYQIDIAELTAAAPQAEAKPKGKRERQYVYGALYSDGQRTWRGHAKVPQWLWDHAAGRPLSEFRVDAAITRHATRSVPKRNTLVYRVRKSLNLSQTQFAEKLKVSTKTVSRWELGHANPSDTHTALIRQLDTANSDGEREAA